MNNSTATGRSRAEAGTEFSAAESRATVAAKAANRGVMFGIPARLNAEASLRTSGKLY